MKDRADLMYESRVHTGHQMFCAGLTSDGKSLYQGQQAAKEVYQRATAAVTESAQAAGHLTDAPLYAVRNRGLDWLASDRFPTCCGSVNMMNVEHLDSKDDTEATKGAKGETTKEETFPDVPSKENDGLRKRVAGPKLKADKKSD